MDRDLPFGLIADVDQHMGRRDANDAAFDDPAGFYRAQTFFKERFKLVGAAFARAGFFFFLFSHEPKLRSC